MVTVKNFFAQSAHKLVPCSPALKMMVTPLNAIHYYFSRSSQQLCAFRVEKGREKRSRGRDRGGCSLKQMFVVGLTRVLGASLRLMPAMMM